MTARIGGVVFLSQWRSSSRSARWVELLYHVSAEGRPYGPVWDVLNPLMVVTVALGAMAAAVAGANDGI